MNELITIENNVPVLDIEVASQIAQFERTLKEIKEKEEELRNCIKEEMQKKMIKTIVTPEMTITLKSSYDREDFKKADFKRDYPDLFDSYVKMTTIAESIQIKLSEVTDEV